ncbi:NAD(P)H-binding protein [Streptomyces sp. 372A]
MIRVTAANGNRGKRLIPTLVAAGAEVRACVRSAGSAQALRAGGATDVLVGDRADPAVLARAMRGVETVYSVGPALHHDFIGSPTC